ncbi:MAG: S41 family peptidase [Proteobacteria bacterium]|nr:S41 family peptidase [Pseudomonadota bacterium]
MMMKKNRNIKLWVMLGIAVVFWTLGAGFNGDLAASNDEAYKGLKLFSDVLEMVKDMYVDEVDPNELIENAIQGMVHSLDPHSALLTPEDLVDLQVDTQGEFSGIGISISMRDNFVTVVAPIAGTPAHKAGIKTGDRIIKADGIQTRDLKEAVRLMRGAKGTTVVITILREGEPEPIDFSIVRDVIPLESVKYKKLKPGFGYVWLTNFQEKTTKDLVSALKELDTKEDPMKGLVLDLRDNPGGLLNQAIDVSDLFLESGTLLSIKGRDARKNKFFSATPNSKKSEYPIVILINGGSASASEIVAGALQDHKRALLLGTTSFGKGSVQSVENLRDGYGLKLTIARYYTPSGRSIQATGIEPDIYLSYKIIDEEALVQNQDRRLKEKDLMNHLGSEPGVKPEEKTGDEGPKEKEAVKKEGLRGGETRFGELDPVELQKDNQIVRALEILISYDIFKVIKK